MRNSERAILAALLLLLSACSDPSPPVVELNTAVDVQHYSLSLTLDPETASLVGQVDMVVQHPDTLQTLVLAFGTLAIDSVQVDGQRVETERAPGQLRIPLSADGQPSSRVAIGYHGQADVGVYQAEHGGQPVFFTDGWPNRGRGWMPGIYHPADPATWALTLTVPSGYEAVASGRLQSLDTLRSDSHHQVRYQWTLDAPAPAYTFAFAVADFSVTETIAADSIPVSFYMLAADSARSSRLHRTPDALAYFSDLLGPYAFGTYASVEVPLQFAGMENAAASFLQANLFEEGADVETVAVHELAHQWFGNQVVPADWQHLWLSEGIATYLTTLFFEHADGPEAARTRWRTMSELSSSRRYSHTALVPAAGASPEDYLTWVPYQKGASVLHLLRLKLGDEAFFNALRRTYHEYAARPLSTDQFQELLEEEGGFNLDRFFDYWVYGNQLPRLKIAWHASTRALSWHIEQDGETLADVPFELVLVDGSKRRVVEAQTGRVVLEDGWSQPDVHPVGVFMDVE